MKRAFRMRGDRVKVQLGKAGREFLGALPGLLETAGDEGDPAAERLHPRAYVNDAQAEAEFRELIGSALEDARQADRDEFVRSAESAELTLEQAEAWLRIIGEARLVIGARLGLTEDGWESGNDPAYGPLHFLGYLQEQLTGALSGTLEL